MLQFIKHRIVIFLVLSAIAGYFVDYGWREPSDLIPLVLSVFLATAGASAFNNIYDRDIDGVMIRTKERVLVSGKLKAGVATLIASAMLLGGLLISYVYFHPLSCLNLILGAFTYIVVYTMWLKRRSWTSVVVGGLAGSFVMLAGSSVYTYPSVASIIFSIIIFIWTPCHFWSLAIANDEDYKSANIPMLPCVVGREKTAKIIFYNVIALVALSAISFRFYSEIPFLISLVLLIPPFLYYTLKLHREQNDRNAILNHRIAIIFMGIVLISLLIRF